MLFELSLVTVKQHSTSLFWQDEMPRLLSQTWNQLVPQGILASSHGKCVETTVWVLRTESLFTRICSARVYTDSNLILPAAHHFCSLYASGSTRCSSSPSYNSQFSCDASASHQPGGPLLLILSSSSAGSDTSAHL